MFGNVKLYLKEHFDGLLMFVCKRHEQEFYVYIVILLFWLSNFEK